MTEKSSEVKSSDILNNIIATIVGGLGVLVIAGIYDYLIKSGNLDFNSLVSSIFLKRFTFSILDLLIIFAVLYYAWERMRFRFMDVFRRPLLHVTGTVNVGQVMGVGSLKIRLADISVRQKDEDSPAIMDILDANDVVIKQVKARVGEVKPVKLFGYTILIKVTETAAGFTLNAKWANVEVKIFD